jgi:hypothetical protein
LFVLLSLQSAHYDEISVFETVPDLGYKVVSVHRTDDVLVQTNGHTPSRHERNDYWAECTRRPVTHHTWQLSYIHCRRDLSQYKNLMFPSVTIAITITITVTVTVPSIFF